MKNSDSFLMEASAGSSTLKGNDDVVCYREWINCYAAISTAYAEEVLGM